MLFNALLAVLAATWYYYAVPNDSVSNNAVNSRQRRAAVRSANALSVNGPTTSRVYLQGSNYGLNFTVPASTSSSPAFLLSRGITKLSDISSQVSCTNDTAGISYTCNWPVPSTQTEGSGYTIAVTIVNTTWIDTTPSFGIAGVANGVKSSLMQSEVATFSVSLPTDVTYNTMDIEVHTVNDGGAATSVDPAESALFSVARNVSTQGSSWQQYTWTVPVSMPNATVGYKIWVWAYPSSTSSSASASSKTLVRVSNVFSVSNLDLTNLYDSQSLTVAFPSSGDLWRTGTNDSVSFSYLPENKYYYSFYADVYSTNPANAMYYNPLRVLSQGDTNKRSFTFPVPESIPMGNYYLYVWGFQSSATTGVPMGGKSGVFLTYGSVAPGSSNSVLAVSSPVAQTTLYKGNTVNIAWTAGMPLSFLDIFLDYVTNSTSTNKTDTSSRGMGKIASNITAGTTKWSWVIPQNTTSHRFYSIRVQGTQSRDQGSGVFSGVTYPLTILSAGENANTIDQGVSADSNLVKDSSTKGSGSQNKGLGDFGAASPSVALSVIFIVAIITASILMV